MANQRMKMIMGNHQIMVTGHRPPEAYGGYERNLPRRGWVIDQLMLFLRGKMVEHEEIELITGMALGVDQDWAECGLTLELPVHAYIPTAGQPSVWNRASRMRYASILERCTSSRIITPGPYTLSCMQRRNIAMVDACDEGVAVWTGRRHGGTYNCVCVLRERGIPLHYINPEDSGWSLLEHDNNIPR